ncbi:hypothetical protein J6590_074840 [Homalodisca vitripennis]|nr:hypothetical protein J6590_074840 [Homalodisca vitripennis]
MAHGKRKISPTPETAEIRKLVAAILNRDHLRRFRERRSPRTPKSHHMNPLLWKNLQPFGIAENHPFSIVQGQHPRQTTHSAWPILGSGLSVEPCPVQEPYPSLTTSPTRRAPREQGGGGDTYPAANLGCPIRSTDPPPILASALLPSGLQYERSIFYPPLTPPHRIGPNVQGSIVHMGCPYYDARRSKPVLKSFLGVLMFSIGGIDSQLVG